MSHGNTRSVRKDMWRLFHLWKGHRRWLALSLILTMVTAFCTLAIPMMSQNLIDDGILTGNSDVILSIGGNMLIAAFIAAACQVATAGIAVRFAEGTSHSLRTNAYNTIQTLSFSDLDRFRTSDLLVRLTTDIQNVKLAVLQGVMNLPMVPFMLIFTIIIIAVNTRAFVPLIAVVIIILAILLYVYLEFVIPVFQIREEKYDRMNARLRENLAGVRVVKAFVRQPLEIAMFREITGEVKAASLKSQTLIALLIPTIFLIIYLALAGIYFIGGKSVLTGGSLSLGAITATAEYIFFLLVPFSLLSSILPAISAARPSLTRIFEMTDAIPSIQDKTQPYNVTPAEIRGRVVFDHVDFRYMASGERENPLVLKNISFTAEPGQTIGFLGSTGSGKSTLVNLIPRFYDVTRGRITIDGTDIRDVPQDMLRKIVGICLQKPNLFSGTIRDNILFGADDQTDTNMISAARCADADGFVSNIPEQYDKAVARQGANFSGGQRQRLCIARTLAGKPKILILDDSTSACDVATESRIQDAIGKEYPEVTKLIVAQRISTVISADIIFLMQNGEIIASGRHDELLNTSGEYKAIYDSQLGTGILARRSS